MLFNTVTVLLVLVSLSLKAHVWAGTAVENPPLCLRKSKASEGENHQFQAFCEVPEAVREETEPDHLDFSRVSH